MAKNLRYDNNNITSQCKTIYNKGETMLLAWLLQNHEGIAFIFTLIYAAFFPVALLESARDQERQSRERSTWKEGVSIKCSSKLLQLLKRIKNLFRHNMHVRFCSQVNINEAHRYIHFFPGSFCLSAFLSVSVLEQQTQESIVIPLFSCGAGLLHLPPVQQWTHT